MSNRGLVRIEDSGDFTWDWSSSNGLLLLAGASGGGGGGGGAFCLEGLNLYGAVGGEGGEGGGPTHVIRDGQTYSVSGGAGGGGGGAGGLQDGELVVGRSGRGSHFGSGGDGGMGANPIQSDDQLIARGGDGGKGYPGEMQIFELSNLQLGESFEISIGAGGSGGSVGEGYMKGRDGQPGSNGFAIFIPLETVR